MVDEVLWNVADKAEKAGEERGEARGRREEKTQIAQKMIQEGLTREQVARMTGLDFSMVESLMGYPPPSSF